MEEKYREHRIVSDPKEVPETDEWKPVVRVEWDEHGQGRSQVLREWLFINSFKTQADAERAGQSLARRWIEDGKPDLESGTWPPETRTD